MANEVVLPDDYYLTNFQSLLDFVYRCYDHLLSEEELGFYRSFQALDHYSQLLYVRLLSRKGVPSPAGALFRLSKLRYNEIENIPATAERLQACGLLCRDPQLPLTQYLPLYTKAELLSFCGESFPKNIKREQLVAALLEKDAAEFLSRLHHLDTVYEVQGGQHFDTFKLCFFGNLRQDLTEYVLRDLGLTRYENYPLDHGNLPFQSRHQVQQHLQYYQCLEQLEQMPPDNLEAVLELNSQLPGGIDGDRTLQRRLERLRLTLARQLERLNALSEAEHLYHQCQLPPARERLARIAVQRGEVDAGLAICRDILAEPHNEEERVFAKSFGHRTARRTEVATDWPAPKTAKPNSETLVLTPSDQRVELLVANHLQYKQLELSNQNIETTTDKQCCFYVENSLFTGMLGLYLWDIVFAPIAGAFFNPFQSAPADFHTPDFYRLRADRLDQRLAELNSQSLSERIWRTYREKRGLANPLVNWTVISEPLMELALTRISAAHWTSLFERLLSDLRHHRSGLPDLILFPAAGGYELIEVKGPGDRLQKNQLRWMAFFERQGIPHRVIHVQWGNGSRKAL